MRVRLVLLFLSLFSTAALYPQDQTKKELTIEDIYQTGGILGVAPESLKWSPDGSKVAFIQRDDGGERGTLYFVDVTTGRRAVLVATEKLSTLAPSASSIKDERKKEAAQRYSVATYHWAPDSKHLLFDAQGQLWLYSLDSGTAVQITSGSDPSIDPKFSPDGNRLAYVRKHNLYVRSISEGRERALTKDADDNLLNGEVDWVYEEELDTRSNYFWSPEGHQIAFLQMNEKEVPSYPITDWIPLHASVDQQKYPQPGDPNPNVRLGVVGSDGGKIRWLTSDDKSGALPLGGNNGDVLLPRFGWVREGLLWAMTMNRIQTRLDLYFIDTSSGKSKLVMTESTDAWIDMHPEVELKTLSSGDGYLWTSWRDGHNHIYLYRFDKQNPLAGEAKVAAQLTHGDWEVESINGVDEQHGIVYFSANEGDWRQENLFAVGLDGQNFHRISKPDGTHNATFDPKNTLYYVDKYSALMKPPTLSLCSVDGSCNSFWQPQSIESYDLQPPKFVDFKAADGSTALLGEILLPTGGPMVANGKIPLIVNPYGGPAAQDVRDAWIGGYLFDQVLAKRGFAVLHVDNRGMGNRGKAFAVAVKHNLGQVELADQLAAIKQALQQFPQLDADRIAFWGWSYGGYFTLYALEHSDLFKGGAAVAPVSDWRNYDSIYTERYMGLPRENEDGYRKSAPVNSAANLHGKLLEVHGTSDDNVHMQNTIQMVNALINAGKQFQLMMYPRKTHGISGTETRVHLFHMIEDHFEEILAPAK